jgi:hypothetical protein
MTIWKGTMMKPSLHQLALAGVLVLANASAMAAVTVQFTHPENYMDVANNEVDRTRVLKELDSYFVALGKRLPAGQNLQIEVLDVDLAGRIEPNFRSNDMRILKGRADWPRMHLRYRLEANGQELASGEEELSDMVYLDRINHYSRGDTLRYEKQMLDAWFERKFGAGKAS